MTKQDDEPLTIAEATKLISDRLPEDETVSKEWVRLQVKDGRIRYTKGSGRTSAYALDRGDVKHVAAIEAHERRAHLYGDRGGYGDAGRDASVDAAARYFGWSDEQRLAARERQQKRDRAERAHDAVQLMLAGLYRDPEYWRRMKDLDEAADRAARIEDSAQILARRLRDGKLIEARAIEILASDDAERGPPAGDDPTSCGGSA